MPAFDSLSKLEYITVHDIKGLLLFCSEQSWNGEIMMWTSNDYADLKFEGTFRFSYNGSIFAGEGLEYLLTFDKLIDTSADSGLVFVPLHPTLETKLYIAWSIHQIFIPIAERFLKHLKESFEGRTGEEIKLHSIFKVNLRIALYNKYDPCR